MAVLTPIHGWLAISELDATALMMLVFGTLVAASVLFNRWLNRLGVPVVLLLLVLGMLGGSEGIGGIEFEDYKFAGRLGTMALVLILFDGGLNTSIGSIRQVLYPAGILATVGVILTAGLTAIFAHLIGLPWPAALLVGAVVSSTDAAAVFAVLRGARISPLPRVGRTLEVESCVNDPMAVILTTAMIQLIGAGESLGWRLFLSVPIQLVMGVAIGVLLGYLGRWVLQRAHLETVGLYPVLTFGLAFLSYGVATLVQGSGFLAVYSTAVVLGASKYLPYRAGLARVHDALAWLSQITMFLVLGMLVFPSRLMEVAGIGLSIGLFLAFVARPLAVLPCVLPFGYSMREIIYIAWIGLRGAVPIILATFPVLANVAGAERIFDIVFFVVVVSSLIPGTTIRWTTRKLRLERAEKPLPPAVIEINSSHQLNGELASFFIEPSVAVCGAFLREIEFPPGCSVVLIVRGSELIAPKGNTRLEPNDHVYVFFRHEERPFIELLFGRLEAGGSLAESG
ncbi:MAG TPA: potassium/proton antiporter [Tepidisphaeraceae bacterium]|nr:potassium/proton antiporter [Tepidisphaeraceae bacterium]